MCLAQRPQPSDASEDQTCGPSVCSQARYHCAPIKKFKNNLDPGQGVKIDDFFSYLTFVTQNIACTDPEGGKGPGPPPPPGKTQVIWDSIGNKQLDPPPLEKVGPPPPCEKIEEFKKLVYGPFFIIFPLPVMLKFTVHITAVHLFTCVAKAVTSRRSRESKPYHIQFKTIVLEAKVSMLKIHRMLNRVITCETYPKMKHLHAKPTT